MTLSMRMKGTVLALAFFTTFLGYAVPQRVEAAAGCPAGTTEQAGDFAHGYRPICVNDSGQTVGSIILPGTFNGGQFTPDPRYDQNGKPNGLNTLAACQDTLNPLKIVACIGPSIVVGFFMGVSSLFLWAMHFSGWLFDTAISQTVVSFGNIYKPIQDQIEIVWSSMRDLANILIIGFFVFIAISIILGLQEYGQKKLIARVLIVATLINFSFLFTTIVINTSNLTAVSIYEKTRVASDNGSFSLQLEKMLGTQTLQAQRESFWSKWDDGFTSLLLHTAVIVIFSLGAAIAFFYAAILLYMRVIVLVFLLVVSAFAFATYLIPSFAQSKVGWNGWWQSLLNNAFFAPLMILTLWMSLLIAHPLANKGDGYLSDIGNSLHDSGTASALLSYVFVLGIFVLGVYIASRLASGIASGTAAFLTAGIPAVAARGVIAPIARATLGAGFDVRAGILEEQAKAQRSSIAQRALEAQRWNKENEKAIAAGLKKARPEGPLPGELASLSSLMKKQKRAEDASKRGYDLMNLKAAQAAGKAAGLPGMLTEESKKSYAETAHKEAENAARQSLKMAMGEEDAKKLANEIYEKERTSLNASHDQNETALAVARQTRDLVRESTGLLEKQREQENIQSGALKQIASDRERLAAGAIDEPTFRQKYDEQSIKIREAREKASVIASQLAARPEIQSADQNLAAAQAAVNKTKNELKTLDDKVAQTAKELRETSKAMTAELAVAKTGDPFTQFMRQQFGVELSPNIVHHTREIVGKQLKVKDKADTRRALRTYDTMMDDSHGAAAKPAGGGAAHP